MEEHFSFDQRLGIQLPDIQLDWEQYSRQTQAAILFYWEQIRGTIPDRIAELEHTINQKQTQLSDESDFPRSCELNSEIADLARHRATARAVDRARRANPHDRQRTTRWIIAKPKKFCCAIGAVATTTLTQSLQRRWRR